MSGSALPGISTTMMSLPWVLTDASETPSPLTREVMICTAWFSLALVTPPLSAVACRVIRVPPRRSSPRRGFQFPSAAAAPNRIQMTAMKMSMVRTGRGLLVATQPTSLSGSSTWC